MARVAIIGTGWGARAQAPAFREAGLEIIGIAGRDPDRTRTIAASLGIPAFDDWHELLRTDADVITITTPPSEHLEMATAVLDAGKHVVSEKPTALNTGEAEQLVAAAKRHPDQIALIDHELRFLPAWQSARGRIGEIGPLRFAEVRYSSPSRGDASRPWNWWSDADRGGGVLGAVGSHFADALRFLGCEFEEVQAVLNTFIAERPSDGGTRRVTSDDFAAVHARLRGGALAVMTLSGVSAADEPSSLTIHGAEGGMRLSGAELQMATRGGKFERVHEGALETRPGNSAGGAFGTGTLLLGHALRKAIDEGDRSGLAAGATFEDGLAQQRVLDAARAAAKSGKWVRV